MKATRLEGALLVWLLLFPPPAPAQQKGSVEGNVIDAVSGSALAGARVKLASHDGAWYTKSGADGRFQFANLAPTYYTIAAELPGYLQPGEVGTRMAYPTSVDLRLPAQGGPARDAAPKATVTIPLAQYGVIVGKVTLPNGYPCAACPVQILDGNGGPPALRNRPNDRPDLIDNLTTDDRGDFREPRLPGGAYYVVATQMGAAVGHEPAFRATVFPGGLDFLTGNTLMVKGGQEVRADVQILRVPGVRVAGKLLPATSTSNNMAHMLTRLVLVNRNYSPLSAGPSTQTEGTEFEFQDVLPGHYTLAAVTYSGGAAMPISQRRAIWGMTQRIEIGAGGVEGVELALKFLEDIRGTVTFGSECGAAPAVRVSGYGTNGLGSQSPTNAYTAADGSFVLRGLSPGPVIIDTWHATDTTGSPVTVKLKLDGHETADRSFDYPTPHGAELQITIGCPNARRTQ